MKFTSTTKALLALAAFVPVPAFAASTDNPVVATWQITTYDTVTSGGLVETSQTSALGNTVKTRTDGLGRTIERVDALGNVSSAQYDNNGNLTQSRDANGTGQDCTYDAQNRRTACTDTHGETRTTVYSVGGLVINQKDAKNVLNADNAQYDARGRMTMSGTRLMGDQTTYTYDVNGNRLTVTDGEGKTTTYAYDNRNLKVAWTFPGQTSTTRGAAGYDTVQYQFDEAARLVAFLRQDGSQDNTTYNFNGTVASKTYVKADATTESQDTFTYDANNRPLTATKGRYNNTVSFTYDPLGRTKTESLTVGTGTPRTVQYAYDADNRTTSITYPNGKVVTRAYTERNQLADVTFDGQNIMTAATYDDGGRETARTLGNGASQARTYRSDNLVATMSTTLPGGADDASSLTYGYDQNKNLTAETYGGTTLAAYSATMDQDAKDRLTKLSRPGDVREWTLTKEGNWASQAVNTVTTETRTHNDNHQVISLSTTANSPTYDAQGNLTGDEQARVYTWDQEKNLVSIVGGTTNVSFSYDALGRRVSKANGGDVTIYVSAGNQEITEYVNGDLVRQNLYGTYVDENIATVNADGSKGYRVMDRRYSTVALLSDTGAVVERYVYDAYGKTTVLTPGGVVRTSSPMTEILWTGRRQDGETPGTYYFRSRYWSCSLGRFLGRDVEYLDGWNLYEGYFAEREGMDWNGMRETSTCGGRLYYTDDYGCCCDKIYLKRDQCCTKGGVEERTRNDSIIWESSDYTTIMQGMRMVKQRFKDCECTRSFYIFAHGTPDSVNLTKANGPFDPKHQAGINKETVLEKTNVENIGGFFKANLKFCSDCIIKIYSCNVGLGNIPQALANATGCKVQAPMGYVSPWFGVVTTDGVTGGSPAWEGAKNFTWQTFSPNGTSGVTDNQYPRPSW